MKNEGEKNKRRDSKEIQTCGDQTMKKWMELFDKETI